ncbi:MAG: N-acetylmuramoyl-L-alanine amidase [Treponema sp.]|jgi:N-acetylmuramoyl-L-alanine amidase|nr:N-acetylmuramoyl-L-alanine amidase [Treponema sp.]
MRTFFCTALAFFLALSPAFSQAAQAASSGAALGLDEGLAALDALASGAASFSWDPLLRTGAFVCGGRRAVFTAAGKAGCRGPLVIDGEKLFSLPAPFLEEGVLRFPREFISQLTAAFSSRIEHEESAYRIAAIIVDPGHGGKDPGAIGKFTIGGKPFQSVEKDITLKTAKLLNERLKSAYADKRVIMTRTGDTYSSLSDRVDMANAVPLEENEAIIFVSIHANASFSKNVRGYEVWHLPPESRRTVIDESKFADSKDIAHIINEMLEEEFTIESKLMTDAILRRMERQLGGLLPSRGAKAQDWFVVRNSRMPAVLVEIGFVSNEKDALLMNDDAYLAKLADALYNGISDFITLFEKSEGFTHPQ